MIPSGLVETCEVGFTVRNQCQYNTYARDLLPLLALAPDQYLAELAEEEALMSKRHEGLHNNPGMDRFGHQVNRFDRSIDPMRPTRTFCPRMPRQRKRRVDTSCGATPSVAHTFSMMQPRRPVWHWSID